MNLDFLRICIVTVCAVVALYPQNGSGAKILSVAFMSIRSHKITYDPLLEALAAKGHEVTVVSPIPATKTVKNIREIQIGDVDQMTSTLPNMFEIKAKGQKLNPFDFIYQQVQECKDILDMPEIQALRSMTFDLIFVPANLNECGLAFAWTFKSNVILISPLSVPGVIAAMYGNPSPTSFVPNMLAGFTEKMTFYERMLNLFSEAMYRGFMYVMFFPAMEKAYKEKLGHDLPSVVDLYKDTSIIFSNSHFSIASVRPFLPDIVEVGGMHCRPARPLPKDLENFVSSSGDDGFILFSMGSLLKGSTMPEEKRKILVHVFSKLKQKVLWKWETEEMEDLPKNVKLSKWVPQQDVLGHPKIKAFITHGGFGSTTEAVYHGVPVIGLPMFADQTINMELAKKSGYAIVLDFNTISEENLLTSVNKIVNDKEYKNQAAAISKTFRDQLSQPLDRAVYWSEYVIRHSGAHHLRSAARDLNFLQYHSLDVIGFIVLTLLLTLWLLWIILKFLLRSFLKIFNSIFFKSKHRVENAKKRE